MTMSFAEDELDCLNRGWVDIPGWEGLYQVHPDGLVRRLWEDGKVRRVLRGTWAGAGYRVVKLCKHGVVTPRYLHEVVCSTFKGPRPKGWPRWEVDHLDRNIWNNAEWNLEWKQHHNNCKNRNNHHAGSFRSGARPAAGQ